jgi:hypothetical protein
MPRLLIGLPFLMLALAVPALTAPIPKNLVTPVAYYPTKVGTKLVYDRNGDEETYLVTKVEKVENGTMVTTEEVRTTGLAPHQKVLVTWEGLFLVSEGGAEYEPAWCTLQLPHNPGAMWETISTRRGILQVRGRRTAKKEERVKTPAGEFRAIVVECEAPSGNGMSEIDTRWYAPEVGLVRLNDELVLKSFTPGK